MKQKLLFSLLLFVAICSNAQFALGPYVKGLASVKDGFLETGIDIPILNKEGAITPFFRVPLSNKDQGLVTLDRNTSELTFVTAFQYGKDPGAAAGPSKGWNITGQLEWAYRVFKYYPTGDKNVENKNTKNTLAGEIKGSIYHGAATSGKQSNYQLRLRFGNQYKAGKEVGVVMPPNQNGVVTTSDMIISPPSKTPVLSPAFAYQKYKGAGSFSYTHALFYDLAGEKNQNNPTNDVQRMRYEFWIFYYPIIAATPNLKIGVGPFISVRTKGQDDFNKVEYGGQITFKVGSLFQSFF